MARFFPQNGRKAYHRKRQTMRLHTAFGVVQLSVWRGKNPTEGTWGIPIGQRWGLGPHQQLSPALEDKLAYFATVAGTYESAAQLARKMSIPIEDSTVRQLVQRLGERAEQQTQQRLKTLPQLMDPKAPESALAVIMIDGYQVRHRGPDWGRKQAQKPRVEWHEQKVGVFYHQDRNARAGRGVASGRRAGAPELGGPAVP